MCNYNLNGRRRSKRPNGNTYAKKKRITPNVETGIYGKDDIGI